VHHRPLDAPTTDGRAGRRPVHPLAPFACLPVGEVRGTAVGQNGEVMVPDPTAALIQDVSDLLALSGG
jgi:hypothetical protein